MRAEAETFLQISSADRCSSRTSFPCHFDAAQDRRVVTFMLLDKIRVTGVRHVDGEGEARRKNTRKLLTGERQDRIQHALQEVSGGTFAGLGTDLLVIEHRADVDHALRRGF